MTQLHLIRHGRPLVDASVAASAWRLSADNEPLVALAAAPDLPRSGRWVSSSEPKAIDTALRLRALLGLPSDDLQQTAALREMRRPAVWTDAAAFGHLVERSLANPAEPAAAGWETAASVLDRVHSEAVRRCEESLEDGDQDIVLVGHGTAWSLLVAAITNQAVDLSTWQRMRMPDWCVLDVSVTAGALNGSVVADWGAWTSQ
jgi:broad specificity phosphatase PhoE